MPNPARVSRDSRHSCYAHFRQMCCIPYLLIVDTSVIVCVFNYASLRSKHRQSEKAIQLKSSCVNQDDLTDILINVASLISWFEQMEWSYAGMG